jgi:hypothetical protein
VGSHLPGWWDAVAFVIGLAVVVRCLHQPREEHVLDRWRITNTREVLEPRKSTNNAPASGGFRALTVHPMVCSVVRTYLRYVSGRSLHTTPVSSYSTNSISTFLKFVAEFAGRCNHTQGYCLRSKPNCNAIRAQTTEKNSVDRLYSSSALIGRKKCPST